MISLLWLNHFAFASPVSLEVGVESRSISHPFVNVEYQLPESYVSLQSDHLTWHKDKTNGNIQNWFALMGQGYRTYQTIQKFEDGALDLSSSFQTSYIGFEVGQLRTAQREIQFGGRLFTGYYWFSNYGQNIEDRTPQIRVNIETLMQWYKYGHLVTSSLGSIAVFTEDLHQYPHANFQWDYFGARTFEPILGVAMGTIQTPDDLALYRIGGEQAGFTPLMGADWGEFWVDDYVINRIGGRYEGEIKDFRYQLGFRSDFALLRTSEADNQWKIGTGLFHSLQWRNWSIYSHAGYGFWQENNLPSFSISVGWFPETDIPS